MGREEVVYRRKSGQSSQSYLTYDRNGGKAVTLTGKKRGRYPPGGVNNRYRSPLPAVMGFDPHSLADFRIRLKRVREADEVRWRASRRLVEPAHVRHTLNRLCVALREASLAEDMKTALLSAIRSGNAERIQDLSGERLKELTGLPPTKAIRALCLLLNQADEPRSALPVSNLTASQVERLVRAHRNPFDLLLEADVASLLDLGAGDLSFAAELADHYLPRLAKKRQPLVLHCVDRLRPGSRLGGPLHARQDRLERLSRLELLEFRFFGGQDMFALNPLVEAGEIASRYTVVTCWAPATPTFAYEPTRLSRVTIEADLRRTKGAFRTVEVDGEAALEVQHEGRTLLFPPGNSKYADRLPYWTSLLAAGCSWCSARSIPRCFGNCSPSLSPIRPFGRPIES